MCSMCLHWKRIDIKYENVCLQVFARKRDEKIKTNEIMRIYFDIKIFCDWKLIWVRSEMKGGCCCCCCYWYHFVCLLSALVHFVCKMQTYIQCKCLATSHHHGVNQCNACAIILIAIVNHNLHLLLTFAVMRCH